LRDFLRTPAGRLSVEKLDVSSGRKKTAGQINRSSTTGSMSSGEPKRGRMNFVHDAERGAEVHGEIVEPTVLTGKNRAARIDLSIQLGAMVRDARRAMGLSQQTFADLAGVDARARRTPATSIQEVP